jgi:hypothetical protein
MKIDSCRASEGQYDRPIKNPSCNEPSYSTRLSEYMGWEMAELFTRKSEDEGVEIFEYMET